MDGHYIDKMCDSYLLYLLYQQNINMYAQKLSEGKHLSR